MTSLLPIQLTNVLDEYDATLDAIKLAKEKEIKLRKIRQKEMCLFAGVRPSKTIVEELVSTPVAPSPPWVSPKPSPVLVHRQYLVRGVYSIDRKTGEIVLRVSSDWYQRGTWSYSSTSKSMKEVRVVR